ncbi:MAG: hypothetical protein ACTSXH_01230 [Promethearchaeota archaeon]
MNDLWILSDAGIVLFHRHFNEKFDDQLFGALITALNSFAEELVKGGITNLKIGDSIFYIKKKHDYLFIINVKKNYNIKKVEEEMDNIITSFFNAYPKEILDNWDGDIDIFKGFEDKIIDNLKETAKKFEKAFW